VRSYEILSEVAQEPAEARVRAAALPALARLACCVAGVALGLPVCLVGQQPRNHVPFGRFLGIGVRACGSLGRGFALGALARFCFHLFALLALALGLSLGLGLRGCLALFLLCLDRRIVGVGQFRHRPLEKRLPRFTRGLPTLGKAL